MMTIEFRFRKCGNLEMRGHFMLEVLAPPKIQMVLVAVNCLSSQCSVFLVVFCV